MPKVTDTPLNNSASMKVLSETFTDSVCTEIGNVKDKKCVRGGGKIAGWPTNGTLTQGPEYEYSTHGQIFKATGNEAVDIANPMGTPVYATFNGVVKEAYICPGGCGKTGYGNFVILTDQNQTFEIMHAHFNVVKVKTGDTFQRGKLIGEMGTTGNSTGPHVHWEFRRAALSTPNIPQNIVPRNCIKPNNAPTNCTPAYVEWDPNLTVDDSRGGGQKTSPDKVLETYGIKMNGFNPVAERWAREVLSEVSSTRFLDLVKGTIIAPTANSDPWSYNTQSCLKDSEVDIYLDQNQAKYPASEREGIFKITVIHELAHGISRCQPNNVSLYSRHASITGDTHESLYYGGLGGLTMYGRHANETGHDDETGLDFDCPKGNNVFKVNENYADMITYYLSPSSRVKNVCALPSREPNPYTNARYAPYKALAEKIVGKYQPDL